MNENFWVNIKFARAPRYQICALQDSSSTRILVTIPCYDSAGLLRSACRAPFYAAAAVVAAPTPGSRTHELILKRAGERTDDGGRRRGETFRVKLNTSERACDSMRGCDGRGREEGGFGAREGKREGREKNVLAPT